MQYITRLSVVAVLGGASHWWKAHSLWESSTWSEGHNTHAWSSEQSEGVGKGGEREWGGISLNPSGQECPSDAVGDQCSLSLLSNLSLFLLINVLVSLGRYSRFPPVGSWSMGIVLAMQLKLHWINACFSGNFKCNPYLLITFVCDIYNVQSLWN